MDHINEELQHYLDQIAAGLNNEMVPEFEGYSPAEMHNIVYFPFEKGSPIQLAHLSDTDYAQIPLLNQSLYILNLIAKTGELKLTDKGYFPIKTVADIYHQGFIKDIDIEWGITKLYKEIDVHNIILNRFVLEISGLVKKRSNKLSLTKTGMQILSERHSLLERLLKTYGLKLNWGFSDLHKSGIGQIGFAFSLILLKKYGAEMRPITFYAEKYFDAFPDLQNIGVLESENHCYAYRTFAHFMSYLGFAKIVEKNGYKFIGEEALVAKTSLLDNLLKVTPPVRCN